MHASELLAVLCLPLEHGTPLPPPTGMRRHSVKAVVSSEPLPALRKRRRSAMQEEGVEEEGEDECPHSAKRHSTS